MAELIKSALSAAGILGIMGLVFGILLASASKVFFVTEDKRKAQILECLPGANCGGCGYAGCAAYADAMIVGEASAALCNATNQKTVDRIAAILGVEAEVVEKRYAKVRCNGNLQTAQTKYEYQGIADCRAAASLLDGYMQCKFGCVGLGTCATVCQNHAIKVENGVAGVIRELCSGCGKCAAACPKNIIDIIPDQAFLTVGCASHAKGPLTKKACNAGCVGCKICERNCPADAIHVIDDLAVIDHEKCIRCGVCAQKCPVAIIERV